VGPFRVVAETLGAAASDDARARLQVRERVGAGAVVALGAEVAGRGRHRRDR
jgi:alanyl-tRNA synthetase